MRALITGGAGHIGKSTTARLVDHGWEVRILGIDSPVEIAGAEYAQVDILDYDALLQQTRGCDAVIHLAAIRSPSMAPGQDVFRVNVAGTFNVFEAAAAAGIKRVVQASSINALGCAYSTTEINLRYFPVDEEHPSFTTDPYSFSKQTVEQIGAYYWRRDGISSAALRFPWVYSHGMLENESFRQRRELGRAMLDQLASLPESEQQARIAEVKRRALHYREQRSLEYAPEQPQPPRRTMADDVLFWMYTHDRFNFWAFLDELDAAQSLEKSLTAEYEGDHVLFINDSLNWLDTDSRALVRLFFPEVTHFKGDFSDANSLVSIERARALIGFEPEYSVRSLRP